MAQGKKTGGRQKGTPNKATAAKAAEVAASGLTPLDYMLGLLRDTEKDEAVRFEAARAAAPYIHPRLSSMEAKVEADVTGSVTKIERVIVDPQG